MFAVSPPLIRTVFCVDLQNLKPMQFETDKTQKQDSFFSSVFGSAESVTKDYERTEYCSRYTRMNFENLND